ncbi:MAG TPA: tetratricopeptide repeat protein [Actinomycetota bacterium]|nr:tetratricopeptide repeat protein [Actinomycetota bacterium]
MSATMDHVVDVTDATFEQVVVEGSKERPVVVDLWAAWCGPCRTLGPMLEKVAGEREGAFTLAKIDVDANVVGQELLRAVRSQGIPTVVAFRDGQPVSMFIGAYPESEVNRFVDSILPTEAELEVREAEEAVEAGDLENAERGFRETLAEDPANEEAAIGLARILVERGDLDQARPLVAGALPNPEAERLHAAIEVRDWGQEPGTGTLASAKRLAAAGRWREALDGMVGSLQDDRDSARQAMLTVFAVLGDDDELVPPYRRSLAAALF